MCGENCRSACQTKDHESFGACARAAALQIDRYALGQANGPGLDKKKDHTLARFRDAVRSGLTPEAPTLGAVERAEAVLNRG